MKKQTLDIPGIGTVIVTTNQRSKNIRLSVVSGELKVSKPPHVPQRAVYEFINKNNNWAQKKINASRQTKLIHDGDVLARNTVVKFVRTDNDSTRVKCVRTGLEVQLSRSAKADDKETQERLVEALVPIWRRQAKAYLPARLDELARLYDFEYNQLRLKNIHTRWGSCSSSKNINLNIQLMKLDEELIDHVLLHELSHTKALNHGKAFWDVFESVRPGARSERKQLKQMVIF